MQRRRLDFRDFDELAADAERLLAGGYQRLGNWGLAQICDHLAWVMKGSVEGFPLQAPWPIRRLIGPRIGRKILKLRRMRAGVFLPKKLLPQPGGDEAKALREFTEACRFVKEYEGAFCEHPFCGRLSPQQWKDVHLIHGGHHLSFLIPK